VVSVKAGHLRGMIQFEAADLPKLINIEQCFKSEQRILEYT
jgi:hypothetical protein